MTQFAKTVGFILFFPITIPIWLWQRGWPGKLGALLFIFVFAVAVGSIPTPEERVALDARATVIAGMPTRTPTPVPTNTVVPVVATEMPAAALTPVANLPFASGGLGLNRDEWERVNGAGVSNGFYTQYLGGAVEGGYDVLFHEDKVFLIERMWGGNRSISSLEADVFGETLIPFDSTLVEVYSPEGRPETTVRLYMSESLKNQFGNIGWTGGEPGNHIVQYNTFDGVVTRLSVSTGNSP